MTECQKALKHFFKHCKACLVRRYERLVPEYIMPKAFKTKVSWKFDEEATIHGSAILSDDGRELWAEDFKGGPFIIPPAGGQIEVGYSEITLGPYTVGELFKKAPRRRLKKLSNSRAIRVAEAFSAYGKVNGCGIQSLNGEDAIAIYFEEANRDRLEEAPTEFESWPVVCEIIGKIRMD